MSEPYLWLKWLHIVSATVLFGTGIGTAFQMWMAHRSGSIEAIAVVARHTVLADWLFTLTAGLVQPTSGVALALVTGQGLAAGWLVASYALYLLALGCWIRVAWLQIEIRRLAAAARVKGVPLPDAYHRRVREWLALGWPAFLALLAVLALMVMRPQFG